MYPSFFCHKMQKTAPKGGLLTDKAFQLFVCTVILLYIFCIKAR